MNTPVLQLFTYIYDLARPLLLLGLMASSGCVLPTSLQSAPQPVNYPPVLAADNAMPLFGPIAPTADQQLELSFAADDPNLDDTLRARLFKLGLTPGSFDYTGFETTMTATDPQNPQRRNGAFGPLKVCQVLQSGDYYVIVADRPFSTDPAHQDQTPGGLSDQNHWELQCM